VFESVTTSWRQNVMCMVVRVTKMNSHLITLKYRQHSAISHLHTSTVHCCTH
jgi:hypothetical protein